MHNFVGHSSFVCLFNGHELYLFVTNSIKLHELTANKKQITWPLAILKKHAVLQLCGTNFLRVLFFVNILFLY